MSFLSNLRRNTSASDPAGDPPTSGWWGSALIIVATCVAARLISWPGFATHDTLFITADAVRGTYTTYHPLLNGLLMRVLAVPFDSYAVYTSAQIAFCGYLFYRSIMLVGTVHRIAWPLVLSSLMWGLSISTVLYLGIIWKDVLVAYSLLYLSALIFTTRSGSYRMKSCDSVLLTICLVLAVGLRHGMAFNLLLVPALLGFRKVLSTRALWLPILMAAMTIVLLAGLSRTSLVRNDEAHFTKLRIAAISQPLLGIITNPAGYTSDDYSYDGALMFDVFGSDFRSDYRPDYFRNKVVINDEVLLRKAYAALILRTPRLCLLNFAQCVSGRIQMMLATLQPTAQLGGLTFYDLGAATKCESMFAMSVYQCHLLERFESGEKWSPGSRVAQWMASTFVDNRGPIQNLLVWNLIPAFVLAIGTIIVGRPRDAQWIVAVFFILQMMLPFATSMATDYRYYYFLSLYLFAFLPGVINTVLQYIRSRTGRDSLAGGDIRVDRV